MSKPKKMRTTTIELLWHEVEVPHDGHPVIVLRGGSFGAPRKVRVVCGIGALADLARAVNEVQTKREEQVAITRRDIVAALRGEGTP